MLNFFLNIIHRVLAPVALLTTFLSSSLTLVVVSFLLLLLTHYIIYQLYLHPLAHIPGPRPAALTKLWLVYKLRFDDIAFLSVALHKKYGVAVRIAPDQVSFNTLEAVKKIYSPGSYFAKADWYAIMQDAENYFRGGPEWDLLTESNMHRYWTQRRHVGPLYTMNGLKRHEHYIDEVLREFIAKLTTDLAGKTIGLDHWIHVYALDALAQMTLGKRPGYIKYGDDAGMMKRFDTMWRNASVLGQWRLTTYLTHLKDIWFPLQQKAASAAPVIFAWAIPLLQSRVSAVVRASIPTSPSSPANATSNENDDKVPGYLEHHDSQNDVFYSSHIRALHEAAGTGGPADNPDILEDLLHLQATKEDWHPVWTIGMAMTNFGAGHDTITSTLTSILVYICTNPMVLSHVRAELATAVKANALPDPADTIPSYASITASLPYSNACIREAMRLRPVTGMLLMRSVPASGAMIEGINIPAGTTVGVSAFALNHNSAIFGDDAEEFRPERWLKGDRDTRDAKTKPKMAEWERNNINFGGPSRTCPGQSLAKLVYIKAVVAVLRSLWFDMEGKEWQGRAAEGFVARMKGVNAGVVVDPVNY